MADNSNLLYMPVTDTKFKDILTKYVKCNLQDGAWVAGGSVRKLWFGLPWHDQDIDIFFANVEQYQEFADRMNTHVESSIPVPFVFDFNNMVAKQPSISFETANAITYTISDDNLSDSLFKLQAIKRYFVKDIHELFLSFDFTATQFATDGNIIVTTQEAVDDCERHQLRMIKDTTRPFNVLRMTKYTAYGFEPEDNLMKQAVSALANNEAVMIDDDY